jgi:hypothetical protein
VSVFILAQTGIPVIAWSDQRQVSRLDHFIATGWRNDPEWAVEYRRGPDIGRTMRRVSLPPDAVPGTFVTSTAGKCPACDGDGVDGSEDAARFYAYSGKLTSCDECDGTGIAPEAKPQVPSTPENVEEPT